MWSLRGLGLSLPSDVILLVCTKWLGWDSLLADTYIPTTYIGNQFLTADSRDRMEMFLLELVPHDCISLFRGEPGTETPQSSICLTYL